MLNDQSRRSPTGVPNYKEFGYARHRFAGETQNFDGNGPYLRFQAGGGSFGANDGLVSSHQPGGGFENDALFGHAIAAPDRHPAGARRQAPATAPTSPCHINAIPDLNGPAAALGPPSPAAVP